MTVTYSAEVATCRGFGCFWKLLFRWRGSIYKLLWPDLGLYLSIYYLLSLIYRFGLNEPQRRYFEKVSLYCKTYGDLIPVSFILGFYVSIVVKRWWDSFNCIPWPDTLAFFVSAYIHGQDDRGRLMRRTIMRYANLAFVITLTCISPCVKKRFPTMDHLVDAGIMLPNEKKVMEQLKTSHSTYWMPLVWASSICIRARKEGRVRDDFALNTLVEAIANYRSLCGGLYNYDWISIPLVYTQVVTLVVYTFFVATLMGRQYLDPEQGYPGYDVDLYIPVFNFLQFFFYMGWLKVAETLVNPFGEDDDDFEVNWVIDRDIQVSYLIVDEMHQEHPELIKDQYWDEIMPDLPYTAAAMPFYSEPPMGSAANLVIPPHEAEFLPLETVEENEDELNDVKVNGIPCESSNNRRGLTQNLSGSSYSGISKLGRSFNPTSYEGKGILHMMTDLFSRESSIRKKKLRKAPSKDTLGPSNSCDTSGPPTPDEYKDRGGFHDDIFHLSDLSLADSNSRGTGSAQSPSYYSTMHAEDIFWNKKLDRRRRNLQRSVSKVSTPKSEAPDDESLRLPHSALRKKKSTNSLKQFFRSGKYRGSQKSLLSSGCKDRGRSKLTLNSESIDMPDINSEVNDNFSPNEEDINSPTNSDNEVTVREVYDSTKNINSPKPSLPISFNRPLSSLPQGFDFSPPIQTSSQLVKESSTSTLVNLDGSLDSNPPIEIKNLPEDSPVFKDADKTTVDNSVLSKAVSLDENPTVFSMPKKTVSHPKRSSSLNASENVSGSTSGLHKFLSSRRNRKFSRTISQPASPTSYESPSFRRKFFTPKGLFGRRASKEESSHRGSLHVHINPEVVASSQSLVENKNVRNNSSKASDV
ncbi:hypothetical protein JTE90_027527 [Oedothorax gibbosus]|uniref:Bestrophin homolog n=1 Tax=Oedothorax gibbosus TaxID=931172 RepID=A0AAV6VMN3_9ARAC|nr:hypothetical protein JTE90_027527 [Oedothorax gibbosus]